MQQILSDASLFHEADAPGTFVKAYHTQVSRSGRFVFWGTTALLLPLEGLMIYLLLLLMRDPYSPSHSHLASRCSCSYLLHMLVSTRRSGIMIDW